jgi:hypothetical protein
VQARIEIQKPTEGVLYDDEKYTHPISSLYPLLYSFGSHRGHPMKEMSVLLKDQPEFPRHCEGDAEIGNVGERGLQILLPRFRRTLPTACTESRLAGVIHKLPFGREAYTSAPKAMVPQLMIFKKVSRI